MDCSRADAAFDALLAYELNCMKYDKAGRPTALPAGEGISDFAEMYGTTRAEMQSRWDDVERNLKARAKFDGLLGPQNPYQYRLTA